MAVSRYDNHRNGKGPIYGTFTTSVRQYFDAEMQHPVFNLYTACVQVKCAGTVEDTATGNITIGVPTYIDIRLFASNTSLCHNK